VTQTGKQDQYAVRQAEEALVVERAAHIQAGAGNGKI